MWMTKMKRFGEVILAHSVALLLGALLEGFFHPLAPILPWSPGTATVKVVHSENSKPLEPGQVTQLVLKHGPKELERIQIPDYRFCSLQAGQYDVDVYVDNILTTSQRFDIEKARNTLAEVKIPAQAKVFVQVFGTDGKPVAGVVVQIVPLQNSTMVLRKETIEDRDTVASDGRDKPAGTTGFLFLQPTKSPSDAYKVSVLWKNRELASKVVELRTGDNPPVEFKLSKPAP